MFKWINAGCSYLAFANIDIYVKLKKRKGPYQETIYPWGYHVKTIDRELFITKPGSTEYDFPVPFIENYDFCIDANIVGNDSAIKHKGLMFTYEQKKKKFNKFDRSALDFPIWADCVIGNTHIFTTNGMFEIKDLIPKTTDSTDLYISTPFGVKKSTKLFKSKKRKIRKIVTKSHYMLKSSNNELFMTLLDGWKKAKDIKIGDKVGIVIGKNVWAKKCVRFNFDYEEYINSRCKNIPKIIKCKICKKEFKKLDSHVYNKHGITISEYKKQFGVKYTTCKEVKVNSHVDNRLDDLSVPKKMSKDLARLLGYLIGDGQVRPHSFNISCGIDKDFAEDAVRCINSVFPDCTVKLIESVTSKKDGGKHISGTGVKIYTVYSQWSSKLMGFLDYIGCPYKTARKKRIPWSVLQSPKEYVIEFVKGLMECDGTVGPSGIGYCSHSTKLRREMRSLFTNLGMLTNLLEYKTTKLPSGKIINKYNGVIHIRTKDDIILYKELIGFVSKRKQNNLDVLYNKRRKGHGNKNKVINKLALFIPPEVSYWDEVIENKQLKKKQITYDFTIDEVHTYIANGFYVHNSGGFQITGGKVLFINPYDLANWYNHTTDYGMTLDIPPSPNTPFSVILQSAKIQKLNTEKILEKLDDSVTLYNISHGFTKKEREEYIDIVDRPDLNRWAIGCSYYGNAFDLIYSILSVIKYKKAESYHVFGISDTKLIPILAWIGKYYNITSDSSTPLQAGSRSGIFSQVGYKLKKMAAGYSDKASNKILQFPGHHPYMPCSCNICSAINTTEIIHESKHGGICHRVCILHNINCMYKYVNIWAELAQSCDLNSYKKHVSKIVSKKERSPWFASLDYIEEINNTTFNKAFNKYKSYLTLFQIKNMFDFSKSILFNGQDDTEEYNVETTIKNAIDRYNQYHANTKDFKEPKIKKKKKKEEIIKTKKKKDKINTSGISKGIKGVGKSKRKIKSHKEPRKVKNAKKKTKNS